MKTLTKTIAAFAGLLLLAGCAAAAEDTTPKNVGPGYGPGWRHEEMIKARQSGQFGPGPMMMNRAAAPGQTFGPGRMGPPLNADGTVDTTKLPAWCPYNQQAPTK
ncbi:hypothetical protein [Magnetospirillum moscoviense]|uniref:Secreted protein n=1 Tax=Magnetospirillum moscoviense TaxID=1437059 RepID=A0A178MSI7_9PROT|nr:hypothetical protein [Magnetospirillum moscoviense]MBF0325667.1 hypothetical protein [Alphaproteobacteria bacterium]OAN51161.1 hypothetical protein A6A05_11320 [Magnetospirillum moscoviense]